MIIRATKCRYAPLEQRFDRGKYRDVSDRKNVKRGVLVGLDLSHNKDYKVGNASDPLLVVHGKVDDTHEELRDNLERMGLWMDEFQPIDIPRKDRNGKASYAPAFKALPRSASRIDRYIRVIENESEGFAFTSDTDVEAQIPDTQQSLKDYGQAESEQPVKEAQT